MEFFNKKSGEATEGRGFIVKCGEAPFEGGGSPVGGGGPGGRGGGRVCENLIELSMCNALIETVEYI